MRKKILVGFGIFILILAAAFIYLNNRNRTLSPSGSATLSAGNMTVSVDYSRPSVRDRLIFGSESEGALQPFGQYWRLGANEPTKLTVSTDFKFGDTNLPAGEYDMYAVPGEKEFKLALNAGDRLWGFSEPDYTEDLASVMVPVMRTDSSEEQFTITLESEGGGINLVFMWSDWSWKGRLLQQ